MMFKTKNHSSPKLSLTRSASVAISESAKKMGNEHVISSYQQDDFEIEDVETPEEQEGCCSLDWLE